MEIGYRRYATFWTVLLHNGYSDNRIKHYNFDRLLVAILNTFEYVAIQYVGPHYFLYTNLKAFYYSICIGRWHFAGGNIHDSTGPCRGIWDNDGEL